MLQALLDVGCKWIAVDNGAIGRRSDRGNFRLSYLFRPLEGGEFNVPSDTELTGTTLKVQFVIITDEAYQSIPYLIRPYPKQILDNPSRAVNYRLYKARIIIECAIGIMRSKWHILTKSIEISVSNDIHVVKAICILHTFVLQQEPHE
jgi:hypothetical protein